MIGSGLVTKSFGGLVFSNDATKTTILGIAGDYLRIGDAGTTAHSLNSEDDLMVTGDFEVKGTTYLDGETVHADDRVLALGAGYDIQMFYETADANANDFRIFFTIGGNNVPVLSIGDASCSNLDLGLFDGVTQPAIAMIEKDAKYATVANATSTGADVAVLTTATAGTFTAAVVGDEVRVTAGTNATVGRYTIVTATDEYNITLDRNWCTGGAVSGGTIVCYHHVQCVSAQGINLKVKETDFAAGDFELVGQGAWLGYRADLHELQIVEPGGTMYAVALA